MGDFEDFVNANLGIRKPLITDAGHPSGSAKSAGIPGSHYVDSDSNFLYEKTGWDNVQDWAHIATLGDPRGGGGGGGGAGNPAGLSGQIQFNYDGEFGASPYFIFDDTSGAFSGASGKVDYLHVGYITGQTGHFQEELIVGDPSEPGVEEVFVVEDGDIVAAGAASFSGNIDAPTGIFDDLFVNDDASFKDLLIQGDLTVIGTTHVHEVIDTTIEGTISGHTGLFDNLIFNGKDIGDEIDLLSGSLNSTGYFLDDKIDSLSGRTIAQDAYLNHEIKFLSGSLLDDLDYLSGRIDEDIDELSGVIDIVSGESTADIVALADDVSLVSGDLFVVSGIDIASSTALADDIYLINKKLPFVGAYNIPNGVSTLQVSFSSVSNGNNYVKAPTVLGNVRIASSSSNVYNCSFYNVDHAGFSVKFSPTIAENTNILDFTVYNND